MIRKGSLSGNVRHLQGRERIGEMTGFRAIGCFILCLLLAQAPPALPHGLITAECFAPAYTPEWQGAGPSLFLSKQGEESGPPLSDEELRTLVGQAARAALPNVTEHGASRIILWDESGGRQESALGRAGGQSMLTISR